MNHTLHPYPAYKPSGVQWLGDVPGHWEVLPARALMSEVISRGHGNEEMLSVTIAEGVIPQSQLLEESPQKDGSRLDRTDYKLVQPGDLVYNKMRAWQGAAGMSTYRGIISPAYVVQRPRGAAISKYLHRIIRFPAFATEAQRWSYGIASDMWSLRPEHFKLIQLPRPPLPEQQAIVRYLDHVDGRIRRLVDAKRRLISLLEEERQAVINQAVTRGLDPNAPLKPSGVDWLGEMPAHWERRRLKTILRPIDKRSTSGKETLLALRRDHGVVVYADHFSRPSQSSSLVGYKLVRAGQLVVNRLQANNGYIFDSTLEGLVSPDYSVFADRTPIDMKFLSDLLGIPSYRAYFRQNATGLGTGTAGFLRLYDEKFLDTLVYLPPVGEQASVVEHVARATSNIDAAIGRARRQIELVEEYRTRLIADVVTGKLDVMEAAAQLPEESAGELS